MRASLKVSVAAFAWEAEVVLQTRRKYWKLAQCGPFLGTEFLGFAVSKSIRNVTVVVLMDEFIFAEQAG